MPYDDIVLEAEDKMEKAVGVLAEELRGVRTGRASAALVDGLKVEAYGTQNPLKSLASITVPEPRMILVKPFDPGTINDIIKAIQKSEVGLTPQSDGKIIRLAVPPLSEERRKQMSKMVKEFGEKAKVAIRNIRREANTTADAEEKGKTISEDEAKRVKDEIDRLTKEYEGKTQESVDKKTKEVMEV
ncbi:MAG TPA: ribosome recycling factor [Planctomycetota bacterium]|nr:ribosome recycling factor [Planctomycetota bacterium]